jgi:hypothetical protein
MIGVWSLPGPTALLGRVLTGLMRDRARVLHAPRDPAGLRSALEQRLLHAGLGTLSIDSPAPQGFCAELADRIMAPADLPVPALMDADGLRGAVVLVTAAGPLETDVQSFARFVRRQREETGPRLVVITGDGQACLDDVATEEVRDAVGPLDGAAYAAWLPRSDDQLFGQLIASIAIEVAAWDVGLLDHLTVLPALQAVRPDLHVSAWAGGQAQAWAGVALRWEHGCLDRWAGVDAEHPAWLAANRPALLAKRVWRGQLATLLPWIELHRLRLVDRHKRILRPATDAAGEVELLDWGPLVFQLKARNESLSNAAVPFRTARNELAHGRPVGWPLVKSCLLNSARVLCAG